MNEPVKVINVKLPVSIHAELRHLSFDEKVNMSVVMAMAGEALLQKRLEEKERNNGLR